MRVYMQQFRLDLVARDQEARLAINQAMREFRTELNDSVRGMKLFGVELRQSLDEHHDKLAKAQEERLSYSLKEMVESFNNVVVEFTKQSQKSHGEITDHAKKTLNEFYEGSSDVLGRLEKSLSNTGEKVESAMLSIGSSITDQVEINKSNFSKISDNIFSSNECVVSAIAEFESTINIAFQKISGNTGSTINKVEEASSVLIKTSSQIDAAVNSALESVNSLVMMNNQQLQSASDLFINKESHDEQVASQLNRAIRELTSEVAKLSSEHHSQYDSIGSIAVDFKLIANNLNEEVVSIREGQLELLSRLDKVRSDDLDYKFESGIDSEPKPDYLAVNHSDQLVEMNRKENNSESDDQGQEFNEGGNTASPKKNPTKRFKYLFGGDLNK